MYHFKLIIGLGDVVIPVYDDEPSSIIAYTLATIDHASAITGVKSNTLRDLSRGVEMIFEASFRNELDMKENDVLPHENSYDSDKEPMGLESHMINAYASIKGHENIETFASDKDCLNLEPKITPEKPNQNLTVKIFQNPITIPVQSTPTDNYAAGIYSEWRWKHITLNSNMTGFSSSAKTASAINLAMNLVRGGGLMNDNLGLNSTGGLTSFPTHRDSRDTGLISFPVHRESKISDESRNDLRLEDEFTPPPIINPRIASIPNVLNEYDIKGPEIRLIAGQIQKILLSHDSNHFKHKFTDEYSGTSFFCTAFYPKQFFALRQCCFPAGETEYIEALSRCLKFNAVGGKSGSTFSKTQDDRLILKYVHRIELKFLLENAVQYFEYMSRSFYNNLPTVFCFMLVSLFNFSVLLKFLEFINSLGKKEMVKDCILIM